MPTLARQSAVEVRPQAEAAPMLDVEDLHTHLLTARTPVKAVDGLSLRIRAGDTLGLVGESGCGKSMTAMSILRLIGPPHAAISGAVRFQGKDLLALTERQMSDVRGNDIAMIFQEPMTSLNPVLSVSRQITETLARHQHLSGS